MPIKVRQMNTHTNTCAHETFVNELAKRQSESNKNSQKKLSKKNEEKKLCKVVPNKFGK